MQHSRKRRRSRRFPASVRHEPSTSSLSVVLCTRFEKNDLFGNMSALYIVAEHTSGERCRVPSIALSLLSQPPYFTPPPPPPLVPLSAEDIYFYYNHLPRSLLSQQISCHRCANRSWRAHAGSLMLPEINKSREFELSLPRPSVIPSRDHRRWNIYSCKFYEPGRIQYSRPIKDILFSISWWLLYRWYGGMEEGV